jgi:hypothetical protein
VPDRTPYPRTHPYGSTRDKDNLMNLELIEDAAARFGARFAAELDLVDEYCHGGAEVICTGGNCWAISGTIANGLRVEATNGVMEGAFGGGGERFWLGLFDPDADQLAYIDSDKGSLAEQLMIADTITLTQVTALRDHRRPPKLHVSVTLTPHTVVSDTDGCQLKVTNLSRHRDRIEVSGPDGSYQSVDLTPDQLATLVTQLATRTTS